MQARRSFVILALGFSMWATLAAGVAAKPKRNNATRAAEAKDVL
jgi:hypothetical protein